MFFNIYSITTDTDNDKNANKYNGMTPMASFTNMV